MAITFDSGFEEAAKHHTLDIMSATVYICMGLGTPEICQGGQGMSSTRDFILGRAEMHKNARNTRRGFMLRVAVLSVIAPLALAACGGDDETGTDVTDEAAAEEEQAEGESDEAADADPLAEAADFYEGNTITLAVGSSPGGGYDAYLRMLAPYLEEALGATVVVENQTGGGGLLMINNAVTDPEQDGTLLM